MRSLDALSWPARRWLVDRLVGQHAYSRHVGPSGAWTFIDCTTGSSNTPAAPITFQRMYEPYDQEAARGIEQISRDIGRRLWGRGKAS
jgi:hypothetical protein